MPGPWPHAHSNGLVWPGSVWPGAKTAPTRTVPRHSFRDALASALATCPPIVAVAGANVFPLKVPERDRLPAVVYEVSRVKRRHSLDGPIGIALAQARVAAVAADPDDCEALAEAVRRYFDGFTGPLGGTHLVVQETVSFDEQDHYDPPVDSSDEGTYWTVFPYDFLFREV